MDADREDRIRQRAHQLWEEQGRPEGRQADHWDQARTEFGETEMYPDAQPLSFDGRLIRNGHLGRRQQSRA